MSTAVPRPHQLATPRLLLRPLAGADQTAFHGLNIDPGVRRYLFDDRIVAPDDSATMLARSLDLLEGEGLGLFGIALREDPALIGWAGYLRKAPLPLEIGYALLPAYWGRGIAVEACRAVMTWGIRHAGLAEFHASVDAPNRASVRVLEKLGFEQTRRADALIQYALDASRLDQSDVVCSVAE